MTNGTIKATGDNQEQYAFNYPETNFPNWKQVLPDFTDKKTMKVSFDINLLVRLAKSLGADNKHDCLVTLEIEDPERAFIVRPNNSKDAYGIQMPVRIK